MTAKTARPVLMRDTNGNTRPIPAGTEVHARPRKKGREISIWLPGTLFRQSVYASALLIP